MADLALRARRLEAGEEDRAAAALGQFRHGLRGVIAEARAQMLDILDIEPGDIHVLQRIEGVEGRDDAVGIVDRDGPGRGQPVQQRLRRLGRQADGSAPCRESCRRRHCGRSQFAAASEVSCAAAEQPLHGRAEPMARAFAADDAFVRHPVHLDHAARTFERFEAVPRRGAVFEQAAAFRDRAAPRRRSPRGRAANATAAAGHGCSPRPRSCRAAS